MEEIFYSAVIAPQTGVSRRLGWRPQRSLPTLIALLAGGEVVGLENVAKGAHGLRAIVEG